MPTGLVAAWAGGDSAMNPTIIDPRRRAIEAVATSLLELSSSIFMQRADSFAY